MVDEQQPPEDDATSTESSGGEPRNAAPEGSEPTGRRRSTFTPPPQDAQYDPSATDDDALAGALASEFRRWTPSPRPSDAEEPPRVPAPEPAPSAPPAPEPAPSAPPAPEPAPPVAPAPPAPPAPPAAEPPSTAPQYSPSYSRPPRAVPAEPLVPAPPAPPASAPPAPAPPSPAAQPESPQQPEPPTTQAPPTPPSTQLPPAPPTPFDPAAPVLPPPPRRESLTDDELLAAANLDSPDHDTSALLDLLEQQLQLREAEVRRLSEWEREVRETAGPAAEPLVAEVRAQFTGSIPVVGAAAAQPTAPPQAPQPPAAQPPAAQPPTAPPPSPQPPASQPPVVEEEQPAPIEASGPPQSGPELDLALADAPPPFGAVAANVPPPSSVPAEELPPPLVEPTAPQPVDPEVVTGSTSLEGILGAGVAAADPSVEPAAAEPDLTTDDTADVSRAAVERPADQAPAALGFEDLLRDPEPDPDPAPSADADEHAPGPAADGVAVAAASAAVAATATTVPPDAVPPDADPVATVRPTNPPATRVETVGPEPTPAEQRAGASVRLFWLWFAVNASVVSIGLGAVILSLGMSLRQAILATLIGVAISFLPLGLGTLAGKWSGQPTMIVSRSTFGLAGNVIPASVALISRALWASALLWMLAAGIAEILVGGEVVTAVGRLELALIAGGVGLALAALVAGFGFGLISVVSAIVSALAGILVVGIIVLTVDYVDLSLALSVPDGSWALMVTGAILVFSVIGLAWANSSGDVARYQGRATVGAAAVLWATFGATVPAFLLISWGAVLAASNPFIAEGLVANPVDLVSRLLPLWYPVPLIAAVALSLICAAALALYSGGFALQAVGARIARPLSVLIVVILTGALLAALLLVVPDLDVLFRDVVTTLAVPIAAWAGIFGAETMIRSRRVHAASLLRSGGVYPAIRWVNTVMLLVATGVGWGVTTASVVGLDWQGYLWPFTGLSAEDPLVSSDLGVVVALVLGLLTPIVAGIPALRKLQAAERVAAGDDGLAPATGLVTVQTGTTTTTVPVVGPRA